MAACARGAMIGSAALAALTSAPDRQTDAESAARAAVCGASLQHECIDNTTIATRSTHASIAALHLHATVEQYQQNDELHYV